MNSFGERLKTARESQKLTQEKLAEKIDVRASTIGMYEQNRREPDLATLKKLSNELAISLDYLLNTDAKKSEEKNTFELSKTEILLLKKYRYAPDNIKKGVNSILSIEDAPLAENTETINTRSFTIANISVK